MKGLFQLFGMCFPSLDDSDSHASAINPASGLPMVGDTMGGLDIAGNLFGESKPMGCGGLWDD